MGRGFSSLSVGGVFLTRLIVCDSVSNSSCPVRDKYSIKSLDIYIGRDFIISKFDIGVLGQIDRAEIIPLEPDLDNASVGIKENKTAHPQGKKCAVCFLTLKFTTESKKKT